MSSKSSFLTTGLLMVVAGLLATPATIAAGPTKPSMPTKSFSREEYMLLNLNRGNDSTGTHIADSLKQVRIMIRDLDKSLRQLQQVEREFGKSKGRPDDHFLAPAEARLEQSLKTAQELATQLEASRVELKDSIHQALLMAQ